MNQRKPKRTAKMKATRANSHLVNVLIPKPLLAIVDDQADALDLERAQWIRDAAREKIERDDPTALRRLALAGGAL